MSKLTPEEMEAQIIVDEFKLKILGKSLKEKKKEIAEIKKHSDYLNQSLNILQWSYDAALSSLAEKDKQLERAKELLELLISNNSESTTNPGSWWIRECPTSKYLNDVKDFLTELNKENGK